MTAGKVLRLKLRNRDTIGLLFNYSRSEAIQVRFVGRNHNIAIAAKLRCAVEHARLAAHKQVAYLVAGKRRKDFDYRVRDQVSHQLLSRTATTLPTHASAPAATCSTTLAKILHRRELPRVPWHFGLWQTLTF